MRIQCERPIKVMNKIIGGPEPLICLPLIAKTTEALAHQVTELMPLSPDLLEWRVDGFDSAEVPAKTLQALADLRAVIPSIPLIFTCRIHTEGGMRTIDQPTRLALICDAIKTGYLDIVDIELCNSLDFIQTIIDTAGRHNVKVILSFHDFEKTPEEGVIFERLQRAQQMGGHIAKVAIMPNTIADVLVLLKATLKARTQGLQIPIVTIAMGAQGVITRLAGGLFGSDITFAIGKNASAPGQIPIQELRQAMALLY